MWPLGSPLHQRLSPYFSPSQLPHNWLHSWGGGGGREGQSPPQTCPRSPLPQCIIGLVHALSSSSSSHTELGLLTMRAGSPSSQGSRCGFQTIELTLRGPVALQTCAPSTSVGVEWEGVSLWVLCIQRLPLGQTAPQTATNRGTGERAAPSAVLRKGTLGCREVLLAVSPSQCKLVSSQGTFCGDSRNLGLDQSPLCNF